MCRWTLVGPEKGISHSKPKGHSVPASHSLDLPQWHHCLCLVRWLPPGQWNRLLLYPPGSICRECRYDIIDVKCPNILQKNPTFHFPYLHRFDITWCYLFKCVSLQEMRFVATSRSRIRTLLHSVLQMWTTTAATLSAQLKIARWRAAALSTITLDGGSTSVV